MSEREEITPEDSVVPVFRCPDPVEEPDHLPSPSVDDLRLSAYRDHADPVFFKWKRGEATEQDWLDAVAAVRAEFPDEAD